MKLVFFISVLCMALPGPVRGFSAKAFFSWLCDLEERMAGRNAPLQILLYDGPSVLPVIWVHIIKFLPIALALQYSLYRAIPPAILETARLEGVSKSWRLRKITWPQVRSGFFLGILAISLLSFGEVSTGKIVETPACTPFSQELFNQMHYGVSTTVVALSLMQIGMLSLLYVGSLLSYRWFFAGNTSRPASGRDE
jgi:ABC-type spermidine/putrescine transport system permease subunit II